ncbi:MAG: Hsp20/alpha crystallin family protein [SAR324 cluster bacterium]|nr:Hsp20/alpha crystallin family protein [SAR324 cluster bacterium]
MLLSDALNRILTLQESLDRTTNRDYFGLGTTSRGVNPEINVFKKQNNLMVIAELPGIQKDKLVLEVKDKFLRLAGQYKTEDYGTGVSVHRKERKNRSFDRTVKLPFRVESEKVQAQYKNGLLTIELPQAESDQAKQISIS